MSNPIDELISLRNKSVTESYDGVHVVFVIDTGHLSKDATASLMDSGCLDEATMLNDKEVPISDLHEKYPNCQISLHIRPPSNIHDCCVFKDRWDMLEKVSWWGRKYVSYYLWDERVKIEYGDNDIANQNVKETIEILRVCELLKGICDFEEVSGGTKNLIFLNKSRIDIPLILDRMAYGIRKPDELLKIVNPDTPGHEMARAILINNLSHFLSHSDRSTRLTKLLIRFKEFKDKCISEHKIFNATDKYTEMNSEIRDKLLNFEKSLHSVLSDIYLKLFGLPIALIAALCKDRPLTTGERLLFLIGILFATVVVVFMTKSQAHLLEYTKNSIVDANRDLSMKYGVSVNELAPRFAAIQSWCRNIRRWLVVTEVLAYVLLPIAFIIMFCYF